WLFLVCFLFQAEDGIRADLVTGVQTCALPISSKLRSQESPASVAERQEAEERYKRMSAEIEDLKTTIQSYQQRLSEQREEIRKEIGRASCRERLENTDGAGEFKEQDEQ